MMKTSLLTLLIVGMPLWTHADSISTQEAVAQAAVWLGTERIEVVRSTDVYSIVCRSDTTGFAIVAMAADAPRRMLGFSDGSYWNESLLPPALLEWLDALEHSIGSMETTEKSAASPRRAGIAPDEQPTRTSVKPLLTCHWHQSSPYNDLAPIITDGQVKTVAGCVAIAGAQVTYYWRRDNPTHTLRDTPTYIYGGAPVEEVVPKGSPNHWELMLDQYNAYSTTDARAAAAQLCYVLGTTSYLNYANSTGGSIREVANAMYSQYRIRSSYTNKSKYGQMAWEKLLYDNLSKGWPLVCSGQGNGGHAFVCDGYDAQLDLFHFNFGWGGSGDGYYPVDDTENAMGGYYAGQAALIDTRPQTLNIQTDLTLTTLDETTGQIELTAQIVDDSTLPIRQLLLFITDDGTAPTEADKAAWKGGTVTNDNLLHTVDISFTSANATSGRYVTLTDENLYVLATIQLNAATDIHHLASEQKDATRLIFDMQGQRLPYMDAPGCYIVKDAQGVRKVMKQ